MKQGSENCFSDAYTLSWNLYYKVLLRALLLHKSTPLPDTCNITPKPTSCLDDSDT